MSSASRPGVGADQRPVVLSAVTLHKHRVPDHPQIREPSRERLSYFRDCAAPNRGSSIIDGQLAIS